MKTNPQRDGIEPELTTRQTLWTLLVTAASVVAGLTVFAFGLKAILDWATK